MLAVVPCSGLCGGLEIFIVYKIQQCTCSVLLCCVLHVHNLSLSCNYCSGQIKSSLIKELADKNWKIRGEALQKVWMYTILYNTYAQFVLYWLQCIVLYIHDYHVCSMLYV